MNIHTIFEKPFDFEPYMEKRLLSIDNEEERAFARQFLVDGLRQIMRESEQSYQGLENRVYAEISAENDRHHVYMTIVNRGQYDITNEAWFPVLEGDEKTKSKQDIPANLKTPLLVDCIFYSGKGELLNQVAQPSPLSGTIQTKKGEFPAQFRLTPALRYRESVESMYHLFQANGLPWTTLNCGYLLRFFDVQLVAVEGLQNKDEILDYTVSFGGLDSHLSKNCIPVWNIQKIEYKSTQFVSPVINSKNYEHTFPRSTFGIEHGYLIEGNKDILSIRHTKDKIAIITAEETFEKWKAYQVIYKPPRNLSCFNFPILQNAPKDSFVDRFAAHMRTILYSKLEIIRQIERYDLMDVLKLEDVTLLTHTTEPYDDTYMSVMNVSSIETIDQPYLTLESLDWFIQDDWVNRAEQRILLFRFSNPAPHFLQYDLLCFLISQIQRQFNEYRCEAVLEPGGTDL